MPTINKQTIKKGRDAVDAYRLAHSQLYAQGWHKGIPEEHIPLLNILIKTLGKLGFGSLDDFFSANDQLNLKEAGLINKTELTEDDARILEGMWH